MVEHLLKRQIASRTLTSAGNSHFTPLEGLCQALLTVLPQSCREVATILMLEVAHVMILGANTSFYLFLHYAHLESSKAAQLSSSGLSRTLEVCRGSKMMFWKRQGSRNQTGLGLNPDSAICWLWRLGDIVLPL